MKCVCCEKEIEVQYVTVENIDKTTFQKPYYECCGYLRSDEDSNIYFDGIFKNKECTFVTRQDNKSTRITVKYPKHFGDLAACLYTVYSNTWTIGNTRQYYTWNYPFNFKDKEKQIKQIELMMVFI